MSKQISQREARRMRKQLREYENRISLGDSVRESHEIGRWTFDVSFIQAVRVAERLGFRAELETVTTTNEVRVYGVRRREK